MEIGRHIEILLLNNDCVTVPGLGGFVAHYTSARYDERDGMFLPPTRTLGFNPKLAINDSLLAQSYMEAHDISYPEATERIDSDVSEMKRLMENEGSCELHGVGTLSLSGNGGYEFEPCEAGILTPGLYGLYTLDIHTLKSPMRARKEDKAELTTGILAAAAAIAVIVFFLISPPEYNNVPGERLMSADFKPACPIITATTPVADNDITTSRAANAATEEANTAEGASTPQGKAIAAPAKEAESPKESHTPYYTIVLACKIPSKNAAAYAEKLRNDGLDSVHVYNMAEDPKVVYGHYPNEREAYTALRKLHRGEPFAEAWVYKVRKPGK